jgi:AcrR family transcriptional regulator
MTVVKGTRPEPVDPPSTSSGRSFRRSQADRRDQTRAALLESAARHLSRYGYGNVVLEQIARDAGYTRGALYYLFADKQELSLAVIQWVLETWSEEVAPQVDAEADPVAALFTLARAHARFCRRDLARVAMALRVEFSGQDHPVGRVVEAAYADLVVRCEQLINAGREAGTLPAGPPVRVTAYALVGALEGVTIALAGQRAHDERYAAQVVAGVLGIDSPEQP